MLRILLLFVVSYGLLLGLCGPSVAAERTTIALTSTRPGGMSAADQQFVENLATLMDLAVQSDESLAVVERRQIDLAIQELALSRARSADQSLQLGKLVTADLLVMLELRPSDDKENSKPSALLRIVEAKTAAIRGIVVATDVDESSIEDVAEQFARYVLAVVQQPQMPTITVAVAPFESVGRFDRLRPLELGIRDLVTSQLLRRTVQVVQRSNLEQLLRELNLIQSGFADKDRLPRTLPDREAAYLVKGEIDERQVDGKFTVVVRGELRHAATAKVRESFEFECSPAELEGQLATRVDQFAKHFGVADASRIQTDGGRGGHEHDSLKSVALEKRTSDGFRPVPPRIDSMVVLCVISTAVPSVQIAQASHPRRATDNFQASWDREPVAAPRSRSRRLRTATPAKGMRRSF
jgi:hypothetical protein